MLDDEVRPTTPEPGGPAPVEPEGPAAPSEPVYAEPQRGSAPAPLPAAYAGGFPPSGDVTSDDRLMAALAWISTVVLQLPILPVILLIAEGNKNRHFQRYHSLASIVFWVAAIGYEILAGIVYGILGVITLGCGLACLWPIFLVPHVIAVFYAYKAYMGEQPEIPLISDLLRGQHWS